MAECFVFRNEQGEITRVNAPNGKESYLFKNLTNLVKDKEQALKLWAQVYTPTFKNWFGDWELLEEAKKYKDQIKGMYATLAKDNLEHVLFEAAQQAVTARTDKNGAAASAFGYDIMAIASQMFPNVKLGDEFVPTVSKAVDGNGEPTIHYHGSATYDEKRGAVKNEFNNFDFYKPKIFGKHRGLSDVENVGMFFSSDPRIAAEYGTGEIEDNYSAFLNIKNPIDLINKALKEGKDIDGENLVSELAVKYFKEGYDGVIGTEVNHGGVNYVVFNPNQIKSIYNKGDFATDSDNIYEAKTQKNSIVGSLQAQGKLGKRVGVLTYEIPIDHANFNLIDQQQKAFEIQQQLNKKAGKEVAQVVVVNGNPAIMVDGNIKRFIDQLDPNDNQAYNQYLIDNLYTSKDTPTTTELVNNAAKMAKDLGREDLVDLARLINKYLIKNPTLTSLNIDESPDMPEGVKAYYNRTTNRVVFPRNTIGSGTLEYEASTVLHEILHGLTFQPFFKEKNGIPLTQEERDFEDRKSVV